MKNSNSISSRRKFIQQSTLAGTAIILANPLQLFARNNQLAGVNDLDINHVIDTENSCLYNTSVYAWLRTDIPLEIGHTYWRDIHGTLISRIPGTFLYRQLHMSPAINILSANFQKYVKPVDPADQPQGLAHTFYHDEAGRQRFFDHPMTKKYMVQDEVKLVKANATCWSKGDNARTLKDTSNNLSPQGKPINDEYAVSLIFRGGTSANTRKENLIRLSNQLNQHAKVTRLRYHLLEEYDDEHFPEGQVGHRRPVDVRYNAWIELGVQSNTDLAKVLEPDLLEILNNLDTIHIYPIFDKYTIMAKGKATIVGLKGYPAYQTILAAGANNQLDPGLLEDVYGKVPKE